MMLFTFLPWRSMTRVTVELDLVHHEIILDVILHVNIPETLSYMRPVWLMPGMVEMAWLSRMRLMRISLFRICHIVSFHPTHSLVGAWWHMFLRIQCSLVVLSLASSIKSANKSNPRSMVGWLVIRAIWMRFTTAQVEACP